METIENNKLIAEFMEWIMHTPNGKAFSFKTPFADGFTPLHELKFNSSWDWLMPVVEKVNKVCGYDDYNTHRLHIQRVFADCVFENAVSKREVHKAVVEFIKWYNKNK